MLNTIITKLFVNVRNIFKNRANFRTWLSLLTSVIFSLLFALTPNANLIVTFVFCAITLLLGFLYAIHQASPWKSLFNKLHKTSYWWVCLSAIILLFAFAPLVVRSIENNGFDVQYIMQSRTMVL